MAQRASREEVVILSPAGQIKSVENLKGPVPGSLFSQKEEISEDP